MPSADLAARSNVWGTSIRHLTIVAVETTSASISRALYLLTLRPDLQEKLRKELRDARHENGELTHDHLVSLPFLEAVCRETLRL